MIAAVSFAYIAIALWYLLGFTRGRWALNPGPLFVLQQLLFFLGLLPLFDPAIEADNVHLYMCFGALCMFIAGNVFCQIALPNARASGSFWAAPVCRVETAARFNVLIGSIILVSIVACIAYYRAVGYNLFMMGIVSVITGRGQLNDVSTLRLNAYAGGQYFAPGYVNQFKNLLFPLLLSYLFARYILLRRRTDLLIVIVLVPLCLVFLLGTGQRGAMFLACVTAVLFFMACLPRKPKRIVIAAILAMLFAALLLSTLILGRSISRVQSSGDVAALGTEVLDRFSSGNQVSAVNGFRFIYEQPLHYGLGEWVYAFRGLIPGHEEGRVGLASELFRQAYGSTRGTAPASIWGGAWYEFGIGGVLGLAFALGILYHVVYASLCRGEKTLGRLLAYAALTQILGMWSTGGLEYVFYGGLITVLVLMALMKASVGSSGSSGLVDVFIGGRGWFSLSQRRKRGMDLQRQKRVYGVREGESL